ncbi:MAG TPA: Gfo/Idh/MocA family oxidoreductase [Verrucomicrobiae bacterium]|nr:Gfo/Idh/MocA family oxidoreductase [Verrucomicrobiae bacterium]
MSASARKVKILGAGSIGNHLAHASRSLGWEVTICDVDPAALDRTRNQIYPGRYGKWDDAIRLCPVADSPRGGFDIICIGTPPDAHVPLVVGALGEKPALILVEKPVCGPFLEGAREMWDAVAASGTRVCVGYDHVLAPATRKVEALIAAKAVGEPMTLDAEFREHWGGIFGAHPWLEGPWQTYLGYWRRGGGSGGEHSHATNLWQHLALCCGWGRVTEVSALVEFGRARDAEFDKIFALHARTEKGGYGRIVQDVVTRPTRKWARVQCAEGAIEWRANQGPRGDVVAVLHADGRTEEFDFPKKRPDDFICELRHIDDLLAGRAVESPTSLARGMDTMLVLAAGYESGITRKPCSIDYANGYQRSALRPA